MDLCKYETIFSSGKSMSMLVQMGILLFQPYPFFNNLYLQTADMYNGFSFKFKINYVLVLLGFFRLFIVLRVFLLRTLYMSPRASRNCRMYGCKSNYLFAIKCLFKDTPMALIGIVFFVSIIVFALGLRIAERNLNFEYQIHKQAANPQDLENFENAIWLTIITMTTVGYGDFYPRTMIGRIIDVILVIWGIFIVSLMVVVLTNALDMDPSEERALIVLNRLEVKNTVKQKAANLMSANFRKYQLTKKMKADSKLQKTLKDELNQTQIKVSNSSKEFQEANKKIRSMYEMDNVYEEMTRQFEFINDEIGFLTDNQRETIGCLRQFLEQRKKSQQTQFTEGQVKGMTQTQ